MRSFISVALLLISFTVTSQTREYEVYFDVDYQPNTGCSISHPGLPNINGIENKITVQTQDSPPQITSSTLSTCNGNVFSISNSSINSALGFNTGNGGDDVIEIGINKSDLGSFSTQNVRVYFASGSDSAEDVVVVNSSGGAINLIFTYIIPTLGIFGLILLILAVLVISRYQLNKSVSVMIVLLAISPLVYAITIIVDGQTDDWIGINASASDPIGDTSGLGNHADLTNIFIYQQNNEIFIRMDIVDVENSNPIINSPDTVSILENQTAVIDVQSTDPEGETEGNGLSYSFSGGEDDGLFALDSQTGIITFINAPDFETPLDNDANNIYELEITVSDSNGLTDSQNLSVTVTAVNESPTIITDDNSSIEENQTLAIDVNSTDPDGETEGAGLTYSLSGGLDQALFSIDTNSGVVSFIIAPDFENPTDSGTDNVYDVQVTVTDSGALTDVQDLAITVTDVNEAPVITSTASASVAENQTAAIDVDSTDPEGETEGAGLTYAITGGLDQLLFVIDMNTGELTFNTAPDFDNPTDNGNNNVYDVQVTVTDSGALTDVQDLAITVTDINEAPAITSAASASVAENQTAAIDVNSTDPEGEVEGAGLTYSLSGGLDQALFSIDTNSGVVSFITAPDFENPSDDGTNNVYDVQVTVTDSGALTDVQDIAITVTDVNEAPTITSAASTSVAENQTAAIDVDSTDPEGETDGAGLTYTITGGLDQILFGVDTNTGVLTFNSAPDFDNPVDNGNNNVYDVQVTVTDSGALTDVQDIAITVTDINEAPAITSAASANVAENQTDAIDVNSTDPEGETEGAGLTYAITGGLDQLLFGIDMNSGDLTFNNTPNFESPSDNGNDNVYDVQVTVTDSGALTGVQDISITVTDVNEAPVITSAASASVAENQTSAIDVQSTDPDGDTKGAGLTYSITGGLDQALFGLDPNTGLLTFNSPPDFETPGDDGTNNVYDIQVTVTDSGALTGVQDIAITVTNVNEAPIVFADALYTDKNTVLTGNVMGPNPTADSDPENDPLTVTQLSGSAANIGIQITLPSGALVTVNANGTFSYDPNGQFDSLTTGQTAIDQFIYRVEDPSGLFGDAAAVVTISGVNNPPTANAASGTTDDATPIVITLSGSDVEGDSLTFAISSGPTSGSLGMISQVTTTTAQVTYTPGTVGNQSFTYVANDGTTNSSAATVMINVTASNQPPVATDDSYSSIGNVGLIVPAASGLLANDSDPNMDMISVSAETKATLQGGSVTIAADGSFDYTPPAGYTGTMASADSFSYTLSDTNMATDTGTVSIDISSMIWFIDNSNMSAGNGTLDNPFNTVANFNTNATDSVGDCIFIDETGNGAYVSSITLLNNQKMIGKGSNLTLAASCGLTLPSHSKNITTGGSRPVFNSRTTLGNNNTINGVNYSGATTALTGSDIDDLIVNNVDINVSGLSGSGQNFGVNLIGGTNGANVNFGSVAVASAVQKGIQINDTTGGSYTFNNIFIDASGQEGLYLFNNTSTVTVTMGAIGMFANNVGDAVKIDGGNGNISIAASITNSNNNVVDITNNNAVDITNRTGGVITLSGNINETGTGLNISSNAGFINITGTNNTVNTTNSTAVNISNTTIGSSNVTFRSVSSNGAVNGIVLNNTGVTGSFNITGDGGSTTTGGNNSGGQIQNSTSDAILLTNTNNISLKDMSIISSFVSHINANMVNNLTLDEMNFNTSGFHGVSGSSISNLTLSNSIFNLSGNAANEHGVRIINLLGTSNFTNNQFTRSSTTHLFVQNTSTTSTPDVINLLNNSFSMPVAGTFGDNVSIEAGSAANIDLNIGDGNPGNSNSFIGGQDGVQAFTGTGGQLNVSINNNSTSSLTGVGFNIGGFNNSNLVYDIQNNTVSNSGSTGINTTSIGGANLDGQIINNTINGSTAGQGIQVITEGNGNIKSIIQENDIDNVDFGFGIRAQARAGSGRLDITIVNNDVNLSASPFPLEGIYAESGSSAGGDTNTVCLDIRNNTSVSNFNEGYRVRHRLGTTFLLESFVGNGTIAADVVTHINTTNSNTGTVQVTGTGFTTSGNCTMPVL